MKKIQQDSFTNEDGETFTLTVEPNHDFGTLTSDDFLMAGRTYVVVGGRVPGVTLSKDESDWIEKTWKKFSKSNKLIHDANRTLFGFFCQGKNITKRLASFLTFVTKSMKEFGLS